MSEVGVITEQGDLGLGFNELNDKDAKAVKENFSAEVIAEHSGNKGED